MNYGSCEGMLQGLSHSDSYTWAVENRRPSSSRSINREDSFSSLSSQDMSLTNLCPDYTHTESQVLIHSINIGSILMVAINGSYFTHDVYLFIYFLVLHSSANFPHHVNGEKPFCYSFWGTMKVHNEVFFLLSLSEMWVWGCIFISDAHLHIPDLSSLFNVSCYLRGVI